MFQLIQFYKDRNTNKRKGFCAFTHAFLQRLLDYHTSCLVCGKIGEGPLCQTCINKFIFATPQCLFCEQYAKIGVHKRCLPKTYKLWNPHKNENTAYSKDTKHRDKISLLNIHMYNYNKLAKKLLFSIKSNLYSLDILGIKMLMQHYFNVDPFNLIKRLLQCKANQSAYFILTIIPNSPRNNKKRGFNASRLMAEQFMSILREKLRIKPFYKGQNYIENFLLYEPHLFQNVGEISQKAQINKLKRIQHSLTSIKLKTSLCRKLLKELKLQHNSIKRKRHILLIVFDDIATTNSTMLTAITKLTKCITNTRKGKDLPIKMSIITITIFKRQKVYNNILIAPK